MKVQGRCHCGEITYEAEVEPGSVNVCHCRDCRRYVKVGDSGVRRLLVR